eukprot:CAMPEP_0204572372 /NCGR_PEP_ID=MMETSP0661-20131031/39425_1 /ASSEMBLY_ACC=CAM_ASM_000606 /TAXON_ID=109239 /ORGANISM="Alexandrium margalefi, Strain AMGDE01CS-322" /LENGTH=191 /DNA_ID=CAMNT_0051580719 /DNA_START=138 /DNA_END=715 /DNA_ORIENTATION=-
MANDDWPALHMVEGIVVPQLTEAASAHDDRAQGRPCHRLGREEVLIKPLEPPGRSAMAQELPRASEDEEEAKHQQWVEVRRPHIWQAHGHHHDGAHRLQQEEAAEGAAHQVRPRLVHGLRERHPPQRRRAGHNTAQAPQDAAEDEYDGELVATTSLGSAGSDAAASPRSAAAAARTGTRAAEAIRRAWDPI